MIQLQIGSVKKSFSCPSALVHYQRHMGGVDKGDQIRGHFGGFAAQSHFKKWYKKTLVAVLDCMLLNGWRLWNMSAPKVIGRKRLLIYEFLQVVSHELLNHKTEPLMSPERRITRQVAEQQERQRANDERRLAPRHLVISCSTDQRCIVCQLESSQIEYQAKLFRLEKNEVVRTVIHDSRIGSRKQVSTCSECAVYAHNFVVYNSTKFIHGYFPGKTCMDIYHSTIGQEIWKKTNNGRKKFVVNYKHHIIVEIRKQVSRRMLGLEHE